MSGPGAWGRKRGNVMKRLTILLLVGMLALSVMAQGVIYQGMPNIKLPNGEMIENSRDGTIQATTTIWKQLYDSTDYWTVTLANSTAPVFDNVCGGTAGFTFNDPITTTGAMSAASIVCTAAATFGGGYGATGSTLATDGTAQFDSTVTIGKVSPASAGSLVILGTTSGGITITPIAAGTAATTLINQAGTINVTLPGASCTLPGLGLINLFTVNQELDGGITVDDTNFIVHGTTGAVTTASSLTADNIVCTNAATFGGGYASTGATISTAGVGQFAGAVTSDGTITSGKVGSAGSVVIAGTTSGGISITPIATGTAVTSIINQNAGTCAITLPAASCTLAGLQSSNAWTGVNTFGVDGTGTDIQLYTDVAGSNVLWDADAQTLTGTGSTYILMGETTTGVTTAGGSTMIYGYGRQKTAALTADLIGVRGNARVGIDSASGKVIGGYFTAGNGDPVDDVGYELDIMRGVYAGVCSKAPEDTTATINTACGYEVSMDLDQGTDGHAVTITDAQGLYIVYNTATAGSYATITNGYGVYIKNEATSGTGAALDAAVFIDDTSIGGGLKGWDYGIDMSGVAAGFTTADIRLGKGELIDNNNDGTIGFHGALNLAAADGTTVSSVGVLAGAGNSSTHYSMGAGSDTAVKGLSFYLSTTSITASNVQEGLYVNVDFGVGATDPAPSGDAGRFRAYLNGDNGNAGVALVGSHSTVEMGAGASSTGLVIGSRGNVMFPNENLTTGNFTGAQAELYTQGASSQISGSANASLLRLALNEGTAPTSAAQLSGVNVFDINLFSNLIGEGLVVDNTSTATTVTAKIRIKINGETWWLLADDDHD